jgi:hypothetical protein
MLKVLRVRNKMVDQNLVQWVLEKRKEKFSDENIKSYLIKYGRSEESISEVFKFVNSHSEEELKMGQPPPSEGAVIGTSHYDYFAIGAFLSVFFFPLLGLPLGIISLQHIKHNNQLKGKALAIIGLCFGALSLLIIVFYLALIVISFMGA